MWDLICFILVMGGLCFLFIITAVVIYAEINRGDDDE